MKEFTSLEAVKSCKHLKGVTRLYNKVQLNKPELESLGVELESYVPMLLTLIKKALHADMMVDFKMKEATTETKNVIGSSLSVSDASVETIQGLCDFLRIQISSREREVDDKATTNRKTIAHPGRTSDQRTGSEVSRASQGKSVYSGSNKDNMQKTADTPLR